MHRYDIVVVGGGTAGCVLAARLSEDPDRTVCLVEAGPDYGPLVEGRWPAEMVDARVMPWALDWGPGGEDERSLGARIIGGCSAHNACAMLQGSPADYDEWGAGWSYEHFGPYLERARTMLRTAPRNTDRPGRFHAAFLEAAGAVGFARLTDPNDSAEPVGAVPFPANVGEGRRWNTAFAYLDEARERPNLVVADETLVDRMLFDGRRAVGIVAADGRRFDAETVILSAGTYFSPAMLLRSGIGPEAELNRLGIPVIAALPVGEQLLDHYGSDVTWEPSAQLDAATAEHERAGGLYEAHVVVKAASSGCAPGEWDLHLLSWISPAETPGRFEAAALVFNMKPLSRGRVRLRSTEPTALPLVERGFLSREEDLAPLLEGIDLARTIAAAEPLRELIADELRPGDVEPERFLRETVRNYFHPAGTCPIGKVVDGDCRVLGIEGLLVSDASVMPTIPRANTNLTVAAIAEKVAESLGKG